jgi:NADH-quinone oxidoreductase E subunit
MALPEALSRELEALTAKYPQKRAALIPALHRCQEALGGWISPETMEDLAAFFGLEPVEVFGVASFYPMFHLEPVGKHVVSICHNISCDLRGADEIVEEACRITNAPLHGTSPDGRFTVIPVECQGACANAPMLDLDGVYHEDLDTEKVRRILGGLR